MSWPCGGKQVRITLGRDGSNLDRNLRTADTFFAWYIDDRETFAEDAPNVRWVIAHGAGVSLSLPFIPSMAETLEFCITTGYPFRHA